MLTLVTVRINTFGLSKIQAVYLTTMMLLSEVCFPRLHSGLGEVITWLFLGAHET